MFGSKFGAVAGYGADDEFVVNGPEADDGYGADVDEYGALDE